MLIYPEDEATSNVVTGVLRASLCIVNAQIQLRQFGKGVDDLRGRHKEFNKYLRTYQQGHILIFIDFDGFESRVAEFHEIIDSAFRDRVFVLGFHGNVEDAKRRLGFQGRNEDFGQNLFDQYRAKTCSGDAWDEVFPSYAREQLDALKGKLRSALWRE